jgi:hypothetical protein
VTEQVFEKPCLDCDGTVAFAGPGNGTCPGCGLRMFLTEAGQVGHYPGEGWTEPGYGRRRRRE